jgi:pimeloyl-ACP methyl ester carboxylesterase
MTATLTRLYDDDALEISYAPGSGENAVVSFAGVGLNYVGENYGGLQTEEFSKSLESSTNEVYYVKDKLRHWYFESADTIVEIVNRNLQARDTPSVTCIGNSMGGFGAIYFAPRLLNCRNVIAFAPQSSINTRIVPWEPRWMEWRSSLAPGEGLDTARSLDPHVSYTIFIGLGNRYDLLHVRRLIKKAPETLTAIGLPDVGHGAAAHLKRQGALKPVLLALLASQKEEAMAVLRKTPHDILTLANIEGFLKAAPRFRYQGDGGRNSALR